MLPSSVRKTVRPLDEIGDLLKSALGVGLVLEERSRGYERAW
jgi:hypothetical protein